MNARALCIGPFIAATEFGTPHIIDAKEPTFTIANAVHEQVPDLKNPNKEKTKGIIYFSDYPRGWVINKTNMQLLAGLLGEETEDWIGKRVTLHAVKTNLGPGIEVKGSPDIDRPRDVVVKLPKKSPRTVTLVPTGRGGGRDRGDGQERGRTTDDPTIATRLQTLKAHASASGYDPNAYIRFFGDVARNPDVPVEALIADTSPGGGEMENLAAWLKDNA
jgi:hypothetical protein